MVVTNQNALNSLYFFLFNLPICNYVISPQLSILHPSCRQDGNHHQQSINVNHLEYNCLIFVNNPDHRASRESSL